MATRIKHILRGHPIVPGSMIGKVPPKKGWDFPRPGRLVNVCRTYARYDKDCKYPPNEAITTMTFVKGD